MGRRSSRWALGTIWEDRRGWREVRRLQVVGARMSAAFRELDRMISHLRVMGRYGRA